MPRRSRTKEKRLSVGINISLLLIITIFGIFLALPFRMLFDANYSEQSRNENNSIAAGTEKEKVLAIPMDHRRLKRCPNLQYEDHLMSIFLSDYDENCTYDDDDDDDDADDDADSGSKDEEDNRKDVEETGGCKRGIEKEIKENAEEILKTRQMKSVTVAGHILVTMLLVSAVAALVEVLRIRFARDKGKHDYFTEMLLQRGHTRHKTSHFKRIN